MTPAMRLLSHLGIVDEVLLLSWNQSLSFDDPSRNYTFTKVFSGKGAVSQVMSEAYCGAFT